MKNEWFLDVLTDLKEFAEANDLCAVAAKMEEARMIALAEMAGADDVRRRTGHDAACSGSLH